MAPIRFVSIRAAVAAALLVIGTAVAGVQQGGTPPDALRAFESGLARYVSLRARFEERLPAFDNPRRDGWILLLMRRYLASAIRGARVDAQPGCIFGPVADLVQQTIAEAAYARDAEGLAVGAPDEDEFALDLALNEPIPSWAMSPVPAALLERLPALPPAMEYRIAGGALILWDTRAEILVDVLPDAFLAP